MGEVTGGEGTQVERGGAVSFIGGMCLAGRRYSIHGWHDCLAAAAAAVVVPRLTAVTAAGGGGAARVGREADVLVLFGHVAGGVKCACLLDRLWAQPARKPHDRGAPHPHEAPLLTLPTFRTRPSDACPCQDGGADGRRGGPVVPPGAQAERGLKYMGSAV